ncbi:MAG: DUF378 domain-containing protein [Rickettsiaceae bacterium]
MLKNDSYNILTVIIILIASTGAINWGLIGVLNFNLVAYLFGDYTTVTRVVYTLVGLSGICLIYLSCCIATSDVG